MTRGKLIALRAIALPVIYLVLMGIPPLLGNWDNPTRFFSAWMGNVLSLALIPFFVVYAMALKTASAGDPTPTPPAGEPLKFDEIGVNGQYLVNGLDANGNHMGMSSSPEIKLD
jgi:hypothetical protein